MSLTDRILLKLGWAKARRWWLGVVMSSHKLGDGGIMLLVWWLMGSNEGGWWCS